MLNVFHTTFEVPHTSQCVFITHCDTFLFLSRYITQIAHIHPCFIAKQRYFKPSSPK